jgi:predicted permease
VTWDSVKADARFAVRQLVKAPGFSLVAVLTLALGIGANSTIFSVVNSILFRPTGFARPEQLVDIYTASPNFRYGTSSYPDYRDLREQASAFAGVLNYRFNTLGFTRADVTQPIWNESVSANYFDLLGVPLLIGRGFDGGDDRTGAPPVAIISYAFWRREFAGDAKVLGGSIRLNGRPFTIIGVAPAGFRGMARGVAPAVWIPTAGLETIFPGGDFKEDRGNHSSFIRARLNPGVTVEQARENALAVSKRLGTLHPGTNAGRDFVLVPTAGVVLNPGIDGMLRAAAVAMLVVPGLVLLITCANLATLLLTRASGRRREIAVRFALGAARRDVVRQLLAESLLLATIGGAAGLVLAAWASRALGRFQPPFEVPLSLDLAIDGRVVGFTLLVTVVTGVLFGLAPALRAGRVELAAEMREGTRGAARRSRLQAGLVAAQLAVSMVLLVGSGLLLRSVAGVARLDLGFEPEDAAAVRIDPQQIGYSTDRSVQFYHQLLDRVRTVPGVLAVSFANRLPLNLNVSSNQMYVEGRANAAGELPEVQQAMVGPDYFKAIGGHLAAGRDFSDLDGSTAVPVAIINESAARLLWPGESPLGKRIAADDQGKARTWRQVVGVVRDVKVMTVGERPTPEIFYPVFQAFDSYLTIVARGRGSSGALARSIVTEVHALEPAMPVLMSGGLTETVATALFPLRVGVFLLVVLGLVGLTIASIGLYGIIAQSVAQRTRELGIRLALGAQVPHVLRMVFRDGLLLAGGGIVIGLLLALGLSRLLATWLYGVSPYDPLAFTVAPLVLLGVAMLACWVPARRATRVDPVNALRAE